jgi:hypothetical protein
MGQSIEIDSEIWSLLKREAEPFVDTPNTVLRRLLQLSPYESEATDAELGPVADLGPRNAAAEGRRRRQRKRGPRAPAGTLLPETEYEDPILRVLGERGGSAPAREVIPAVGKLLSEQLMPLDRAALSSGKPRWESRVQFTRLRMRKAGLIDDSAPRGVWRLSPEGLAAYSKLEGPR